MLVAHITVLSHRHYMIATIETSIVPYNGRQTLTVLYSGSIIVTTCWRTAEPMRTGPSSLMASVMAMTHMLPWSFAKCEKFSFTVRCVCPDSEGYAWQLRDVLFVTQHGRSCQIVIPWVGRWLDVHIVVYTDSFNKLGIEFLG